MKINAKLHATDLLNRNNFLKLEIVQSCCFLLNQCFFSQNLNYFFYSKKHNFTFVSKIRNFCLISGKKRAVVSKYRLSRHAFITKILTNSQSGFFRSV
jgi:hypothetical protein